MVERFFKIVMIILMIIGISLAAFNFFAVKAEAAVYWQDLKLDKDPILGTPSVKCFNTGQACISVIEPN
jgi:hypothetical protein